MKTFRILLIALTLLCLTTNLYPKTLDENHKEAIDELKQCSILLAQEKKRWDIIHSNPVTDKWDVSSDASGTMKIHLVIDDGVQNIINDQPIERVYTLSPKQKKLIGNTDVLFGLQLMVPEGPRPLIGIGYRPSFIKGFGIGGETSLTGIEGIVYYIPSQIPFIFADLGFGVNVWKQPTISFGIGLVF